MANNKSNFPLKIRLKEDKNYLLAFDGTPSSVLVFHYLKNNNVKFTPCFVRVSAENEETVRENFCKEFSRKHDKELLVLSILENNKQKNNENTLPEKNASQNVQDAQDDIMENLSGEKEESDDVILDETPENVTSNFEAKDEIKQKNIRNAVISRAALSGNYDAVVFCHNLDDQMESFFVKIMRGFGIRGLRGMKEYQEVRRQDSTRKIVFLRPLLKYSLDEIHHALMRVLNLSNVDELKNKEHFFNRDFTNETEKGYVRNVLIPAYLNGKSSSYVKFAAMIESINDDSDALQHVLQPKKVTSLGWLLSNPTPVISSYIMNVFYEMGKRMPSRVQVLEFVNQLKKKNTNARLVCGDLSLQVNKNVVEAVPLRGNRKMKNYLRNSDSSTKPNQRGKNRKFRKNNEKRTTTVNNNLNNVEKITVL